MLIHRLLILACVLTSIATGQAHPRQALPPYPESTLFMARFDGNDPEATASMAANVNLVDGWSDTALQVEKGGYAGWTGNSWRGTPYVSATEGSIRFWYSPSWTSGERRSEEPGVLTEVFAAGKAPTPWLTVVVLPDGSGIGVVDAGGKPLLGARIKWEAGKWHQVAVAYSAKETVLYLDGVVAATGGALRIPKAKAYGLTLGSSVYADAQALGDYDELTTFSYLLTADDAIHNYKCYSDYAALGIITPEEDAAMEARRLEWQAARELQALMAPMNLESDEPVDYSGGPLRLVEIAYSAAPSSGISNIVSMVIAGGDMGVPYDVFRSIAINGGLTNNWWVWTGRGYQGDTIYATNEPLSMAFYIAASTEDTDGDGLTDAYETLVVRTRPDQPPSVSITSPANSSSMAAPTNVAVIVVATNYLSPATQRLFVNGQLYSTQQGNPVSFTLADPVVGSYDIYATVTDGIGAVATSAVTHISITLPALANLKCWLKADAITNLSGTRVTNWVDQSGNGNNATNSNISAQTGSSPSFLTNQIAGYPAVSFSGKKLTIPGFLTSTQAEAFAVVQPFNATASIGNIWSFSTNAQTTYYYKNGVADAFGRQSPVSFSTSTVTNFQVYNVSASPDEWLARINGNIKAAAISNNVQFDATHWIGGASSPLKKFG